IPFKVFTIAAGVFGINFPMFVIAAAIGRSARFFLVSGMLRLFGKPIEKFIDRWFNILSILFFVCLIGGFVVLKFFLEH
ncbi:MAG TPA: DedA family protein, partial [Candidatus Hydrogenedentes bacterium]|nr:DedA family protein [Candidatus Hydrogenedentota bacterium]